ncbi:MAG: GH3 auxin-responsive promoter family protein [Bacteriovoracia bacterium]
MAITTKIIRALTYPKYRSFVRDCEQIETAQARVWAETKDELRRGDFWRGRVKDRLEDYPVTDYEDYRGALDASYSSDISALTGGKILFWSESGGTTGKAKIYPITPAYKKSFQSTTPPFLHSLTQRFKDFLGKPVLYFAATLPTEKSPAGVEKGFISGYNYRNIPPLLAKKYAFPLGVFRDRDFFFRWGPLYALATDLSAMIAITPSMLEQFSLAIEKNIDSYWPYLEGRINSPPADGLPKVKVSAERVALLRNAFKKKEKHFSYRSVWPSLEFVCCWKTATCGLQLPRLDPWLRGEVPVVDATYSATEGWVTVPLYSDKAGGPLHPGALVTEFFPAGEEPGKNILKPWDLEPGKNYEILLTTKMGFVRFRLYDIVRCTGFFHRSPILEFVEKAGNTVSLGHTRISETHVLNALKNSGLEFPSPWILAPAADASGLLFAHPEQSNHEGESLGVFDKALQEANPEYFEDIRDKLLQPIRRLPLPAQHPLWAKSSHAQTKPKVIQQKPVELT